jgi:prepilin-type N-terminal cleavage/methylation domain-containing protein
MYNVTGMWKIRKGFTLVELLMVFALVGVLSVSTAVISIGSNIKKGNDGKRKGSSFTVVDFNCTA